MDDENKIAVIGDYDSIYGFASLGLSTFPVEGQEKQIEKYKEVMTPAIIQIPGVKGNTGDGIKAVRRSVEQAVGSDILFGE